MAIKEKGEVSITINGAAAEAELTRLTLLAEEYRFEIEKANKAGDMKSSSLFSKRLSEVQSQLRSAKREAKGYQEVLDNLSGASIRDLEMAHRLLRSEIKKLTPETKEFIEKSEQMRVVKSRIEAVNGSIYKQSSFWERASSKLNKYFTMATTFIASVTGLYLVMGKANEAAAQMDDVYSDVMKTTGLTREEVQQLNQELKKIDTRTSREELNKLAVDAGKLGIAKDQVLGFVAASDKIKVALGEDLGEDAIINIGKISDVFKLTSELGVEKSYMSIGSAINAIGQDSAASESYLVEFTQRLAGAGYQAGLSVEQILGFASGMDQSGMKVEMAATAFQTFLMNMFSDTAQFAKYANMEVSDFSKLLETDANAALVKTLKSLNQAGGFKDLIPMFKDMGADGARAVSVLSAAATNIDAITSAQSLANDEFAKGTSLINEFETKNNNAMAQLEKARKKFNDAVIDFGEKLSPIFLTTTKLSSGAIRILADYGKEFLIVGGAVATTALSVKVYAARVAIANTFTAAGTIITKGAAAAYFLLTGNITRASAAWRLMKRSFAASPLGLIATGVAAVGAGLVYLVTKVRAAGKAMREFYADTAKLKLEADSLLGILEKNAAGTEIYKNALAKLKELYGPYIQDLISEKGELKDIATAREEINKAIEVSISNRIKEEQISAISEKRLKQMAGNYETLVGKLKKHAGVGEDAARMYADNLTTMIKAGEDADKIKNVMSKILGDDVISSGAYGKLALFGINYKKMLKEIEDVNKQFSFIALPSADNWVGPILKTAEEINAKKKELEKLSAEEKKAQYDKEISVLEAKEAAELQTLKRSYLARQVSQEEYQKTAEALNITFLSRKNAIAIAYAQDNTDVEAAYTDALIKQQENLDKLIDQFGKDIAASIDDSIGEIDTDINLKVKLEKSSIDDFLEEWRSLQERAQEVKKNVNSSSAADEYKASISNLDELLSKRQITEEEHDKAVGNEKLKRAAYIAGQVNNIASLASDVVSKMQDAELQKLEVQKQKELAAHGTSADARAEIEAKYEEQKLQVQKKYANIEMGIQIGKTVASGALAVVNTFASQGGWTPWAIASAALMSAVTAAQVAAIVAQRNSLMSSSASGNTSSIDVRSVNGYSSGGYTPNSTSDSDAVGVVHANEWVAPAYMVRSNPTIFRLLENMRTKGSSRTVGYKDGGYTSTSQADAQFALSDNAALISAINLLIAKLGLPIRSYIVYQDLVDAEAKANKLKNIGSR